MALLKIRLLGSFVITRDDEPIDPDDWPTQKTQDLLKVLLTERDHVVPKERLMELLWPDLKPSSAANSLRVAISHLRSTLEPHLDRPADSHFVLTRPNGYTFQVTPDPSTSSGRRCWIDVDVFQNVIAKGHEFEHREEWAPAIVAYQKTEDLYRGDYLEEDPYEDWAIGPREQLREVYLDMLSRLAECHARQRHYRRALAACQKALTQDPLRESVYRQAMLCHYRLGQRDRALRAFEQCRNVLAEELGVDPMPETVELHARILREEIPAEPAPAQPAPVPAKLSRPSLPIPPTPLIGREKELDLIRQQLCRENVRLVTLVGPPGIGKTRLGLQIATDLFDEFEDSAFFVRLAPVTDPAQVISTIATALGVWDTGGRPLLETLKDYLQDQHLLLVLDNFEQVVTAAPDVAELLGACLRLKVLVTSREVLHLRGEHEFSVPPLTVPDAESLPAYDHLSQYAAVELFTQRARAVKPDFAVNAESAPAMAEICVRLDGLPLAIELAAARIKLFSPQAILKRLAGASSQTSLQMLRGSARDAPARHQTLRRAIAWSYNLLDEAEQILFRRLAVFVGGCSLEAAEAVCNAGGDLRLDVLDGVASLVDKSLVRQEEGADGEPRFLMLETLREYGLDQLMVNGEAKTVQRRHAGYYLALAEEAAPALRGSEQAMWLGRLVAEHDNLRAALRWAAERGETDIGLQLGGSLWWFWYIRGHSTEGRQWLEEFLAASEGTTTPMRAKALIGAGYLAQEQGDFEMAQSLLEESVRLGRELGDKRSIAAALPFLAEAAWWQGDPTAPSLAEEGLRVSRELGDKHIIATALLILTRVAMQQDTYAAALPLLEESLELFREIGDLFRVTVLLADLGATLRFGDPLAARPHLEESLRLSQELGFKQITGYAHLQLGRLTYEQGSLPAARSHWEQALAVFKVLGDKRGIAWLSMHLGSVTLAQDDPEAACILLEESTLLLREMGDKRGLAYSLSYLGRASLRQGDPATAYPLLEESLGLQQEIGHKRGIPNALESFVGLAVVLDQPERALRLAGAAAALRELAGPIVPSPVPSPEQAELEGYLDMARQALGQEASDEAFADGRAMTMEQAIDDALQTSAST